MWFYNFFPGIFFLFCWQGSHSYLRSTSIQTVNGRTWVKVDDHPAVDVFGEGNTVDENERFKILAFSIPGLLVTVDKYTGKVMVDYNNNHFETHTPEEIKEHVQQDMKSLDQSMQHMRDEMERMREKMWSAFHF